MGPKSFGGQIFDYLKIVGPKTFGSIWKLRKTWNSSVALLSLTCLLKSFSGPISCYINEETVKIIRDGTIMKTGLLVSHVQTCDYRLPGAP